MRIREERPMSQDTRDLLNALGWIGGALFVAVGFTLPIWGALLGLY